MDRAHAFLADLDFNKICRMCLYEKTDLKPLFGARVADMLMFSASIVVSFIICN